MADYTDKRARDLDAIAGKLFDFQQRRVMDGEDYLADAITRATGNLVEAAQEAQALANDYRHHEEGQSTEQTPADDRADVFLGREEPRR